MECPLAVPSRGKLGNVIHGTWTELIYNAWACVKNRRLQQGRKTYLLLMGYQQPSLTLGVAFVLDWSFAKAGAFLWPKSDRVAAGQNQSQPFQYQYRCGLCPNGRSRKSRNQEILPVLGRSMLPPFKRDINNYERLENAKVGPEKEGKLIGTFGTGERSERGDKLIDCCIEINVWWLRTRGFKPICGGGAREWVPGVEWRNQIDYILG